MNKWLSHPHPRSGSIILVSAKTVTFSIPSVFRNHTRSSRQRITMEMHRIVLCTLSYFRRAKYKTAWCLEWVALVQALTTQAWWMASLGALSDHCLWAWCALVRTASRALCNIRSALLLTRQVFPQWRIHSDRSFLRKNPKMLPPLHSSKTYHKISQKYQQRVAAKSSSLAHLMEMIYFPIKSRVPQRMKAVATNQRQNKSRTEAHIFWLKFL